MIATWNWLRTATLLVAVTGIAAAQQDPPSRVARLAWMTGQVSFQPASVDQWTAASLNYPLTTGDNLYTDNGARASLRIGRNSIRLNDGTNFQIVNINDQVVQVSINSGSVSVRVRRLFEGETWEVDTPNGAVTLTQEGEYRIDSDPSRNATMVTVRKGGAQITENNQSFGVNERETAFFTGDGNPDIRDANGDDDFDTFAYSRDRLEDVPPPQYVSQDLDGYEDLNSYGSWSSQSEYGPVWYPRVEAGWAPYRSGRWAWVEPWGWTWVDDEPWGFAPFHYGRWAFVGNRWGWCPGPVAVRPVYAPHLVAFIGGGGFGISVGLGGGGSVGWFPLGPRDPYIPSYHVSQGYIRNVNYSNTRVTNINITNINVTNVNYMNRGVPGAVVAVPQQTFASAQPVQRAIVRLSPEQMRQGQVVGMAPRIAPQRASVLVSAPTQRVVAPPANVASRAVVARMAPPARPVSFQAKQQLLQQTPGQPVAPQQLQTLRQQAPAAAPGRAPIRTINAAQVRPITPTPQRGPVGANPNGIRPPQAPGQPAVRTPQGLPPTQANPNGQRFGQPPTVAPQARPGIAPAPQQPQRVAPTGVPQQTPVPQNGRPQVAPQTNAPGVPQRYGQQPVPPAAQPRVAPNTSVPNRQPYPSSTGRPNEVAPGVRPPTAQQPVPLRQQQQAAPPARPQQEAPPARQQAAPPSTYRQEAPPARQQAAPPPTYRQEAPPVRPQAAPPTYRQEAPPVRPQQEAPVRQQAAPPAQVRPQAAPPQRQASPPQQARPQAAPPQRQAPPPQQARPQAAPPQRAEPARNEDKKQ